jgi:hypothetical protein
VEGVERHNCRLVAAQRAAKSDSRSP